MPPPTQAPATTLPDELIEEIFLRIPPDEPASLVRASLANKLWLGLLTGPAFHGRYRKFHGAPPMLGFFQSGPLFYSDEDPLFVSTTKFPVCIPNPGNSGYSAYGPWDCRHGRLLLGGSHASPENLVILDPITGCRRELYPPGYYSCYAYAAAVLCAVKHCDHRTCHDSPSRVVFIGLDVDDPSFVAYEYEYLPETGERSKPRFHLTHWSKPCSALHLGPDALIELSPPVLIKDTLYFKLMFDGHDYRVGILKYDLSSKCLSLVDVPFAAEYHTTILIGMEDGRLGFANLNGLTLNLWSRQMCSNGVGSWSECRVINLKELLSIPNKRLKLIGSVEGSDKIFLTTELGIYEINLKSLEWKKIWNKETFRTLIPYMRFCYPQGKANPCDPAH